MSHFCFLSQVTGFTPLMYAVKDSRVGLADKFIDIGANVNAKAKVSGRSIPRSGGGAILAACMHGDVIVLSVTPILFFLVEKNKFGLAKCAMKKVRSQQQGRLYGFWCGDGARPDEALATLTEKHDMTPRIYLMH